MNRLYTAEEVRRLREKSGKARKLAVLAGTVALAGCIALCFGLRTENAARRQMAVIALSALGSFTALCLFAEYAVPSKREADHTEGVLREEVKEITGAVGQVAPAFRIPKSIAFHKVTLETPDGPVFLKLNARHRKGFPETGERIRAEIRREYITAWEVIP